MIYKTFGKRAFDLLLLLITIVTLWWLLLLIVFVYCLLTEFPIMYTHTRIGRNNKPFGMKKFRTLSRNEALLLQDRTFPLGTLLRFTSLDELPQLLNVLKGDMSFVGPRPLPEEYLPHYAADQRKRHNVKPGITGLAQVNGRNTISWQKKFELDVDYVNSVSFGMDLRILLKTVVLILCFRKDVSLTEEKFKGN